MSDASSDPELKQAIIAAYSRLVVENYCILASSALLLFDHFVTLNDEIQRIWHRKFTGATLIFLLTRYSATAERITLVVSLFLPVIADKSCVPVLRLDDALNDLSILSVGVFASLRVYAIFSQDWRPLAPMLLFAVTRTVISVYLQIHYTPLAFGPPLYGCGAVFNVPPILYDRLNTTTNVVSLASDVLLLILTWTPVTTLLLRDGTIYFFSVFIVQVFAIVSTQIGSHFVLFQVWTYFNQSFTVIFLCRFMLNLRGVYISDTDDSSSTTHQLTDLHFASQVVGNLGAPLEIRTEKTITESTLDIDDMEVSADPLGAGLSDQHPETIELADHQAEPHYTALGISQA